MYSTKAAIVCSGLMLGAIPALCAAEPTSDHAIEEIVVTAGFRESGLLDSAGSVTVLEAERIRERGGLHLEDALLAVPNVNFSSGGSRARFIQMRGIGELEQFVDPKHFPSVGVTIDGVELIGVASAAMLMDVEQVEVLRGPQGTRFGSSALAGMVNIRSRAPTAEPNARLEAGYGNFDSWYVEAAAGGAITSTLQGRVAVRQATSDGYMDNLALDAEDTDDHDELTARARLRWLPTADLRVDLGLTWVDMDNGYDAFTLDNSRDSLADQPGRDTQELLAFTADAEWQVSEHLSLRALGSISDASELYSYDEDWVFRGFCDGVRCPPAFEFSGFDAIARERDTASLDLRALGDAGRWNWVAGLYTQQRDEDLNRQRFGVFDSAYDTQRYAVYGQLGFSPVEALEFTLGARLEHFSDDYSDSNGQRTASNDTYWSGELSASWQFSDALRVYATLARGAKPGGVNTEASSVGAFMQPRFQGFLASRLQFGTETLFSKEIGVKGLLLDDRLSLRAALFHMDRNNAQLESWMWDPVNFIWLGILDTVDEAQNYGAELELDFAVNDRLSLFASLGWIETNVDRIEVFDLDLDDFVEKRNRDQTKAPRWQYNAGARVMLPRGFSARVAVEGRDDSLYGYYHDGRLQAYTVVNASLAWQRGPLTVRGWARNLLNEDYQVHGLYFANDPRDGFAVNRTYYQPGEPRVYGVTASWQF